MRSAQSFSGMAMVVALGFCLISNSVRAGELAHGGSLSDGFYWQVDGENPDPNNCFYLGTVGAPTDCRFIASQGGYPYYQIAHATRSYQDFREFDFGRRNTQACFGCMK